MSTFRNTTDCISDTRRYVLLIRPKIWVHLFILPRTILWLVFFKISFVSLHELSLKMHNSFNFDIFPFLQYVMMLSIWKLKWRRILSWLMSDKLESIWNEAVKTIALSRMQYCTERRRWSVKCEFRGRSGTRDSLFTSALARSTLRSVPFQLSFTSGTAMLINRS